MDKYEQHTKALQEIKDNAIYKQIIKDSFGGIMYNVANRKKYDDGKKELLDLWEKVTESAADGIVKGAINFLKDE